MEEDKNKPTPEGEVQKTENVLNIGAENPYMMTGYDAANLSINSGADSPKKEPVTEGSAPINPIGPGESVKTTEVSGVGPSTSSTQAELVPESEKTIKSPENVLNVSLESGPITVMGPENNPGPINMVELIPGSTPAPIEGVLSTKTTEAIFEKENEKESSTTTKIKKSEFFSNFMEKMSESPLVKSLNLPNLKQSATDFLKVTTAETLGGLPDFKKVKEEGVGFESIKENSKETINLLKESPLVEKLKEIRDQKRDIFSSKESSEIIETVPVPVTAESQKTEVVEKSQPVVAATPATSSTSTTNVQTQTNQPSTTTVNTQMTQYQPAQNVVPAQNNVTATQFQPSQMTNQLPQTQIPGQPMVINFTEAERKLDRILYALTNGLEVIVKQPY